ncbi:hypothetical protein Tco_1411088 [Tanacetum coccineum]
MGSNYISYDYFAMFNAIWSVRIVLANAVYYIWKERNERVFPTSHKTVKTVLRTIIESIRLQLLSLIVKKSSNTIKQKAHILEIKCRYLEDYYSEDQYAVSIKEDTYVYSAPELNKGNRGMKPNTLMTKIIKGELIDIKGRMDDDLFIYEVEVANIPCDSKIDDDSEHEADDDMGYDPSDVAFTEWLGSKIFNYKTMDHYTMKAL